MRGFTLCLALAASVCWAAADNTKSLLRANTAERAEIESVIAAPVRTEAVAVRILTARLGKAAAARLQESAKLAGLAAAEMGGALSFVGDEVGSNLNFGDVLGVVGHDGLPSPATVKTDGKKALNMFCAVPSCLMAPGLESCGSVLPFASIKGHISRSDFTKGLSENAQRWAEKAAFTEVMTVSASDPTMNTWAGHRVENAT
jgi:hypothetical protein